MKKEQIHGGDIYRNPGVTDFSVNSNPLGKHMRNVCMVIDFNPGTW